MKKTLLLISLLAALFMSSALKAETQSPGQWRLHNTYGTFFKKIIDTPNKVYLLAYGNGYWDWSSSYGIEYPIMFVYDKKEDLIEGYNAQNYLHGNIIKDMWYNSAKKYFLIVYDDFNIDLLYTDDRCYNVPGLASAVVPGYKDINSVTFDPENNKAYVATKFGYIVIDDSKNVISESHLYGNNIKSIARVGDYLLAVTDEGIYKSEAKRNDKHSTWNAFILIEDSPSGVKNILTQKGNDFLYITSDNHLFKGNIDKEGIVTFDSEDILGTNVVTFHEIKDGYFMRTGWEGVLVDKNANVKNISGTSNYRNDIYSASSDTAIWRPIAEKGIEKLIYSNESWSNSPSPTYGQYIKANAPNVFDAANFEYSPKYGMFAANSAFAHFHNDFDTSYLLLISLYKNGQWDIQSPYFLANNWSLVDCHTATFDPSSEDIIWVGAGNNRGLGKYDIQTHKAKTYTPGGSAYQLNYATPKFDANETLWTVRSSPARFYYWKKEDRLSDKSDKFLAIPMPDVSMGTHLIFLPCKGKDNSGSNKIFASNGGYASGLYAYDHNGTLEDTSDDQYKWFENLKDQDGQSINISYVFCMMEDPATGYVWVGGDGGLYWFDPSTVFNSDFHVNRVKVARNDGTGLADYLLEGNSIFSMGIDGAGKKWFGTLGNGVVQTTSNGGEILQHLTKENSYLPGNDVIAIGFEPDSNCVWLGTKTGIAQYFSDSIAPSDDLSEVMAYPNPVRPEYYGHVTITGLMDGALVKIMDASGGLVRELGRSEGGMMLWDLTNSGGRRVPTGVYYVVSSSTGDSSEAAVTKILVMN